MEIKSPQFLEGLGIERSDAAVRLCVAHKNNGFQIRQEFQTFKVLGSPDLDFPEILYLLGAEFAIIIGEIVKVLNSLPQFLIREVLVVNCYIRIVICLFCPAPVVNKLIFYLDALYCRPCDSGIKRSATWSSTSPIQNKSNLFLFPRCLQKNIA